MAGHPRNINSPDQLWELFEDYQKQLEVISVPQSHVKLGVVYLEVQEPMTMEGFKDYCFDKVGCIKRYIDGSLEVDKDQYVTIVTRIKNRIFKHNLSRAAVGLYKENLIAKQLGMADKSEVKQDTTHSGKIEIIVKDTGVPLANSEKDINLDV